jgi:hypothetical protein
MARPSGLSLIDDERSAVAVAIARIEARGRLNILPRWRNRVAWLGQSGGHNTEALMVFSTPGLISLRDWKSSSPAILQRIADLSESPDDDDLEALRLIQDRYQKLVIPANDRSSLGEAALAHLGIDGASGSKFLIYVCIFTDRIDLMSPHYRNAKLIEGHHLIDDLP